VTTTRRAVAVLCIGLIVFAAVMPGAGLAACDVLVPLDALFGMVIAARIRAADPVARPSAPLIPRLPSRAPPIT
jgi:hypothetical protein